MTLICTALLGTSRHNSASRGSLSERRVTRRVRTAFFVFRLRIFRIGAPAPVRTVSRATRVCVRRVKKESSLVTRPKGEFSVEFIRVNSDRVAVRSPSARDFEAAPVSRKEETSRRLKVARKFNVGECC